MKWMKIEKPTTRNGWVSRILFMIMTVLFAAYMCPMCYDDAVMASHQIGIATTPGYEMQTGSFTAALILHAVSFAYYILAGAAMLLLCLRGTLPCCCVAFGLGSGGALWATLINTDLAEFMVYRVGMLSFLYNRDTPFITAFRLIKPIFVLLMIAAASYFLITRLVEHKKSAAQPTE